MSRKDNGISPCPKRRSFLKTVAGSAAIIGATSASTAKPVGSDENGITKPIHQFIKNGKPEKAKEFLEKHNVNHDYAKVSKYPEGNSKIGTQSLFDKDPSDIHFFAYETSAPLYNAEVTWDLSTHFTADCIQPNDVAAVSYDGSRWQVAPYASEWHDYYIEDFYSEPQGFFGMWDDEVAWLMNDDTTGYIGTSLKKAEPYRGNKQNLWGHYEHTWVPPWKLGCAGAQFLGSDVSIGVGSLAVNTSADSWKIRKGPLSI